MDSKIEKGEIMKKYYSLVAVTTLSVALLGNATSTDVSNTVKADSVEVGTLNSLKTVTSSGHWEISPFGEPFYKMSGTLPEGLTSVVKGTLTDNQNGDKISAIAFNGYEQSKSFDIEVRPGMNHVEQNPTHSYTLTISTEDGSFSQDIYIPPFNGNSDKSKQSEGSSSTESSSSSVTPNQIAPSKPSSSPSSESKTEVEKNYSNTETNKSSSSSSSSNDTRESIPELQSKSNEKDSETLHEGQVSPSSTLGSSSSAVKKNTEKKSLLPNTGEKATGLFVSIGAILVIFAVVLGFKKKTDRKG